MARRARRTTAPARHSQGRRRWSAGSGGARLPGRPRRPYRQWPPPKLRGWTSPTIPAPAGSGNVKCLLQAPVQAAAAAGVRRVVRLVTLAEGSVALAVPDGLEAAVLNVAHDQIVVGHVREGRDA